MKEQKLPRWAIKPRHNEKVEATERGWVVARTREILVSVKNLKTRLDELNKVSEPVQTKVDLYIKDIVSHTKKRLSKVVVEQKPKPVAKPKTTTTTPKKRGRKPAATKK